MFSSLLGVSLVFGMSSFKTHSLRKFKRKMLHHNRIKAKVYNYRKIYDRDGKITDSSP